VRGDKPDDARAISALALEGRHVFRVVVVIVSHRFRMQRTDHHDESIAKCARAREIQTDLDLQRAEGEGMTAHPAKPSRPSMSAH